MPVVWKSSFARAAPELAQIPSTDSEVLSESFASAYEEMPFLPGGMLDRGQELDEARGVQVSRGRPVSVNRIDPIAAHQRVKDAGLEGELDFPLDVDTTEQAVDVLIARKRKELYRQQIHGRSEGGGVLATQRFLLAAGTTMADPAGMALNFVPVVSQAKYAGWLRGAGGALGRTGVRAGVGAAEGAVGAAVYEPFLSAAKRSEQADYDMTDSLVNVAFGTALGGGIHSIGGASADAYRSLRGIQHPFEKTPINDAILSGRAAREKEPVTITPELVERGGAKLDEAIDAALGAQARPVVREVPPVVHEATELGEHTATVTVNSEKIGEASAQESGPYLQIKRIDVNEDARGQGIGQEMMIDMARQAEQRGLQLASDVSVSPDQVRVYEALERRGFHVERNLAATVNPETGNLVSNDPREPVFKVGPVPKIILERRPMNAAERVAQASGREREAALRIATDRLAHGEDVNASGLFPDADQRRAAPDVDTAPERSAEADQQVREGDDSLEALEKAADEEVKLAEQQARLMGLEKDDPVMKASESYAQRIDTWANAAELAQACLVRGG